MDLANIAGTALRAAIPYIRCFAAALLLAAPFVHGKSPNGLRDYLYPAQNQGGQLILPSSAEAVVNPGRSPANVTYQAFDGALHDMSQHRGRHVVVLLPLSGPGSNVFTRDHIEELVDRLDLLYEMYRDLLDVEPAGAGLLKLAFVPETCGMGCGLVGAKGIEILTDDLNFENIIRELDAGRLETILVHEMAHNFDGYADYLHYLPDHAHAWTDMFEYFAPYRYGRQALKNEGPDDVYDSSVRAVWKSYVANEAADWERCVRDQDCEEAGLAANNLWAMLYYRIESVHGMDALLGSFEFISEYARRNPAPRTDLDKESLRILSLSVGAGTNLACFADALKWPVSDAARQELAALLGDPAEACADADRDGFSPVTGDCDDGDPSRHLDSLEVPANGADDDCDERVDEEELAETDYGTDPDNFVSSVQTRLPFEARGSASDSEDRDRFHFNLGPTGRVRVTLCTHGDLRAWAAGLTPGGSFLHGSDAYYVYRPGAGCGSVTLDYGDLASGGLSVIPDGRTGDWSLTVSEAAALPPEYSAYFSIASRPGGGSAASVADHDGYLQALGADEIEFWLSGAGLRFSRPLGLSGAVHLTADAFPELADGSRYRLRIRPRAENKPLADFSAGRVFEFRSQAASLPRVDHRFSGAWFDPDHEGEGFIVEVHDNDRALVYWFTYRADGRQRWLLGTGEVQSDRIVVERLYDASGGRFGSEFDPRDVRLRERGALSITFLSCAQALVNYRVDGVGGHQELGRLTELLGHQCEKQPEPPASGISGSWFDPTHDGEGFVVQQLGPEEALVFWFTYDPEGGQSWMVNTGTIDGGRIEFSELVRPAGGRFGRSFRPGQVDRQPWGELILELGCSGGTASYRPTDPDYSDGVQVLQPLTRLQGSHCSFPIR